MSDAAWKPPWIAWAEAVDRCREAERIGKPDPAACEDAERCRLETALLLVHLLNTAAAAAPAMVAKTLAAFEVPDTACRCWLHELEGRVRRLEHDVIGLKEANRELSNRLMAVEEAAPNGRKP